MAELEEDKLQAEIAHIKAQTVQATAEAAKVDAERAASQKTWWYWVIEGMKVVGALVIGGGGFMAAFTGYQLAEVKKEKTELAIEKLQKKVDDSTHQKGELDRAVAAAQLQLDTARKQLRELQTQLVSAKQTAPATDTVALDAAIARTSQIRAGVNSAKADLRSAKTEGGTASSHKDVESRVQDIVVEQLGVNPSQVTPQARLVEDLGANELDLVELMLSYEEEFGVEIRDEDAGSLHTVGDIVRYLRKHAPAAETSRISKSPAGTPSPTP